MGGQGVVALETYRQSLTPEQLRSAQALAHSLNAG
jgi:hypothetical protein